MSIKLKNVRLSANPDAKTAEYAEGVDGKVNVSTSGKKFAVLEFEDDSNPLAVKRAQRNYWMNQNAQGEDTRWPGLAPKELLAKVVGKTIPGKFVTYRVNPHQVTLGDRTITVNKATTFLMQDELNEDRSIEAANFLRIVGNNDINTIIGADDSVLASKQNAGQPETV